MEPQKRIAENVFSPRKREQSRFQRRSGPGLINTDTAGKPVWETEAVDTLDDKNEAQTVYIKTNLPFLLQTNCAYTWALLSLWLARAFKNLLRNIKFS